ncbi:MAG: biotin/lipoyl-binding protein [Acidobacteria bacterium]|nr:biotin/lipoyl-binding protein [Acidobacteriota bacterium]
MRKYLSILLALIGVSFAIYWVKISARPVPVAPPLNEPAQNTYDRTIAGAGIIEASGRNIQINPPIPGQVTQIFVRENDIVKKGDKLFLIDDREQNAKIASAEANIARAEATLATAQAEIATQMAAEQSALANVEQLQALLADAEQVLSSNDRLYQSGVIPYLTFNTSLKSRDAAKARVQQAQAQVEQSRALLNSTKAKITEAEANLKLLKAQRNELLVTLERLMVRAPQDGRILQVNMRLGEMLAITPIQPSIILGETEFLQVRVDVDEVNATRVSAGSQAIAHLKGDASKKISLEFVRIDPYILPKKSLTGDNTERVDVRVLQVIYKFQPPDFSVYVGQQVDVFIDAAPTVAIK